MGISDTTDDELAEHFAFKGDSAIPLTARLRQVVRQKGLNGQEYLVGNVYGDRFERWPDGLRIHTSYVLEEVSENVFRTRSDHHYRVESWAS